MIHKAGEQLGSQAVLPSSVRAETPRLKLEFGDICMVKQDLELRHCSAQAVSHLELISLNGPAQHQWLDQLRLVPAHGDGPGIKPREMFSEVLISTELLFFWTPCTGIPQLQHSGE